VSFRGFLLAGLLVCLLLAGLVSSLASGSPDGLDSVTLEGCTVDDQGEITGGSCAAQEARDPATAGSPLADYGVAGVDGPLATGVAGAVGVLATLAVTVLLLQVIRRRPSGSAAGPAGRDG
jgi:cobalt/nickel transport protein